MRPGPLSAAFAVVALAAGCSSSSPTTPPSTTGTPASTAAPASRPAAPPTIDALLAAGRPIALAHAGGDDAYPHSTPFAFASAVRVGTDVLDLDVQLTKDGVLVVHHDETVDRTTNGTGRVADKSYAELRALDNAHWWTARCTCTGRPEAEYVLRGVRTGARPAPAGAVPDDFVIATFEEIARRFPDKPLNIEIKGNPPGALDTVDTLADALRRLGRESSSVVTSFDDEVVEAFRRKAPTVALSPGLQASARFVLAGEVAPGFRIYQLPPSFSGLPVVNPDLVARLKRAGLVLWLWPNGNGEDVEGYRAWLAMGVDGINASDPPALAQAMPPGSLRPG